MRLFDKIDQDTEEVEIKQGSESKADEQRLREDVESKFGSKGSNESNNTMKSSEIQELKRQNEEILEKLETLLGRMEDNSEDDVPQGDMSGVL